MESFAQLAEADVSAIAPKVIARQIQRVAERARKARAAASAGTLGYNDVVSAVNKVRAENYNPTILFIHPNQEADLLKDNRFIDASKYGAREPLLNGEIGKFAGCKVIVENYSALDNKPIVADPTEAGWLVIKRDVSVKRDELPISESIKIAAFAEYAVKVTQPAAVAHITLA